MPKNAVKHCKQQLMVCHHICIHAVDNTNNLINLYENEMKHLLQWFLVKIEKKNRHQRQHQT